ncbi:hypothetical protein BJY04DRAFT_203563 [Aspergillus karnatakaensis]|uniref:uncharacterized protein n=1 Tax=Aspergillus karnatakaensis TaxID=1810916 RepID=UPI003CCC9DAD
MAQPRKDTLESRMRAKALPNNEMDSIHKPPDPTTDSKQDTPSISMFQVSCRSPELYAISYPNRDKPPSARCSSSSKPAFSADCALNSQIDPRLRSEYGYRHDTGDPGYNHDMNSRSSLKCPQASADRDFDYGHVYRYGYGYGYATGEAILYGSRWSFASKHEGDFKYMQ